MSNDSKENLECLRIVAKGVQDECMKSELQACPTYGDVYFTIHDDIDKFTRTIDLSKYDSQNMGLANIKVSAKHPELKWSYKVLVSSSHFDYIHSAIPGAHEGPWMCRNGRAIPFNSKQTTRIEIDLDENQELEVSYDIVKINDKVLTKMNEQSMYKYGIIRNSIVNTKYINAKHSNMKLNFDHPTYSINFKANKMVRNIRCCYEKNVIGDFEYDVVNDIWSFDFHRLTGNESWTPNDTTLNLSRVDSFNICVDLVNDTDEVKFEYYNVYWNCVQRGSGLTGFTYECT